MRGTMKKTKISIEIESPMLKKLDAMKKKKGWTRRRLFEWIFRTFIERQKI